MRNTELISWLAGYLLLAKPSKLTPETRRTIEAHARLCEYTEKGRLTVTNHMILHDLSELCLADLSSHVLLQYRTLPSPSSEELCYFLQGCFELEPELSSWDQAAAEVVCEELDRNVFGLQPALLRLYYLLQRFIDSDDPLFDCGPLRLELMGVFQHVIDAQYEYDPEVAQQIHSEAHPKIPGQHAEHPTPERAARSEAAACEKANVAYMAQRSSHLPP